MGLRNFSGIKFVKYDVVEMNPFQNSIINFDAHDRDLVMRSPTYQIVAGWYTFLCFDIMGSLTVYNEHTRALTMDIKIDFLKTYRYPNIVGHAKVVKIDESLSDVQMILTNPSGTEVASATARFKLFTVD